MTGPTLVEPDHTPAQVAPDPRGKRQALVLLGVVLAVALVLLALAVIINAGTSAREESAGRDNHGDRTVVLARDGRNAAGIDLVSGTGLVTVRTEDIGDDDLVRISTPDGSRQLPRPAIQDDTVAVSLASADGDDAGGPAVVELVLSSRVTWTVRISGGASQARLDLRGGPVSRIDLASGISTVEVWLPKPAGTATLVETGGASDLTMHAPSGVPVRLAVTGGAGSATVDGVTHSGVSGKTVLDQPGWDAATDRYDVRLMGGVSSIVLDRF